MLFDRMTFFATFAVAFFVVADSLRPVNVIQARDEGDEIIFFPIFYVSDMSRNSILMGHVGMMS